MKTQLIIKLIPDSPEELGAALAGYVNSARDHFEQLKKEGVFGDPERITLYYVIDMEKINEMVPGVENPAQIEGELQ